VEVAALGSDNALVAAGYFHSMVLKTSGTVFTFGNGGNGRLGLGSTADQLSPAEVVGLGSDNALVAAGDAHSMVLKTSGTVFTFGYGANGRLGLGSTLGHLAPVEVVAMGSANLLVAAGKAHSVVIKGPCSAGFYSAAGSTSCTQCAAGTADTDSDPASACEGCSAGFYSAAGSTSCSLMAVVIVVVIVVPTSAGATGFYLRYRQKRKVVVKQRWQTSKRQALQLQAAMDGFQQQQWVQWQGWHRDSWAPYLKIVSAKLEQAYAEGARGAVPMDDKRFVDMDKMLQFRFDHQTTGTFSVQYIWNIYM
jgi:hypothetical protein